MTTRPRRAGRFWQRYVGSIAFVSLLLLGVIGFYRIETTRFDACENGQKVRAALRQAEDEQIAQSKATDPDLFPDIPRAKFEKLVAKSVARAEYRIIHLYAPSDCGSVWPIRGAAGGALGA